MYYDPDYSYPGTTVFPQILGSTSHFELLKSKTEDEDFDR